LTKIFKNTALISILTLLSRILGVIRDMLIASCLGTSSQSDAFFIAFRPFDLARKLFSEGIMNISFIPVFSESFERHGMSKAGSLFFSCFFMLSVIGSCMVWAGIFFCPWLLSFIAPGLISPSETYDLSQTLFRIMAPYTLFILLSALFMGVLNTFANFSIPALTPILFNCVMITSAVIAVPLFKVPAMSIALGVSIGGLLQLAIQLPFIIRTGIFKRAYFRFFHPDLVKIAIIMVPSMIGAASYQMNIMVAACFASGLDEGSISYMYFADRLVQFPLALFAVSLTTVLLPEISKSFSQNNQDKQEQRKKIAEPFSNGVKLVFFITIPAMAGMMALSEPIVRLLFERGAFSDEAVRQTADCLFFLSTGLWAFTGMRVFATLYFSLKRISIPFYSGLIVMVLNLIMGPLLMEWVGLKGLLLSVSLSAAVGFVFLFINIPEKMNIDKREILVSVCRTFFLSAIMFILVRKAADMILPLIYTNFWHNVMVMGLIGSGILLYAGMSFIISKPELEIIRRNIKTVL
jgi:putative peptidoglycan lipid II flippase